MADSSAKVCIYLRVSSAVQDMGGQERDLRAEAERRGWTIAEVYREKVSATGRVKRVMHDQLLRDARSPERHWGRLLVWALDRFGREGFVKTIGEIEELENLGVRFHSLREPMLDSPDDGTPNMARDLLRALLPVISRFESLRRSDRVKVAMTEIRSGRRQTRSGRPPGRPRRLDDEKVSRIVDLRSAGMPWKVIAQRIGLPKGTCAAAYSLASRGLWKPRALEKVGREK